MINFVRFRTKHAGRLLDHGKVSKYALHLLAIKHAHGGNRFTLNERHTKQKYGMGRPSFRSGLKLLIDAGIIINRRQAGRRYATEQFEQASGAFLMLPRELVNEPSDVVAYVIAASLSPKAKTPAEIAARIGITCHKAIKRMHDRAVVLGVIEAVTVAKGKRYACRKTVESQIGGNVTTKAIKPSKKNMVRFQIGENVPGENVPAHLRRKKNKQEEKIIDYSTQDCVPRERSFLVDWRQYDSTAAERGVAWLDRDPNRERPLDREGWNAWLERFHHQHSGSDAKSIPYHLTTPTALDQATDVAYCLAKSHNINVGDHDHLSHWLAVVGVANDIARAISQGHQINSLGFIFDRLFWSQYDDVPTWATDLPTTLNDEQYADAAKNAEAAWSIATDRGQRMSALTLRSTIEFEYFHEMLRKRFGVDVVREALETMPIDSSSVIVGWLAYEGACQQIAKLRASEGGKS